MDKVLEVYNNIKDRLSNPFVFSFICSWLIFNWRIPVSLIWYDKTQFSGCGCHTIFDFISFQLAKGNSILLPLFFAFVYTLTIPFIKNGIRIVSAHAQKWGENEEIKALDGGKIGIEKYLKLKDDYKNATKKLEETIEDEKKYLTVETDLLNEINDVKSELNESLVERNNLKEKIRKINDFSFLNGSWKVTTKYDDKKENEVIEIYIENGTIHTVNNKVREVLCQITDYYYDESNNRIIFIKDYYKNNRNFLSYDHRFKINRLFTDSNTKDRLSGTENFNDITYTKYKY